jgi:hypothetical protein
VDVGASIPYELTVHWETSGKSPYHWRTQVSILDQSDSGYLNGHPHVDINAWDYSLIAPVPSES